MKRIYLLITLLISVIAYTNAQIYIDNEGNVHDQRQKTTTTRNTAQPQTASKSKFDKNKLEFGGDLSFAFGNNTFGLGFSPQVGYKFSKYFSAGAGIGYNYYSKKWDSYYDYSSKYKEHYASLNLYGRFYPIKYLVFSVRPEIGRMWQNYEINDGGVKDKGSYNTFVSSVVIGGGVRFGPMIAQINYDLVQDKYSPYGDNIFYSVGFIF